MDKLLVLFGIVVVLVIIITGGFGIANDWFGLGEFNFFGGGTSPRATGPGGIPTDLYSGGGVSAPPPASSSTGRTDETKKEPRIQISSVSPSGDSKSETLIIANISDSGSAPVLLAGWSIGNTEGNKYSIPLAAKLAGKDPALPILLAPGDEVIIHTGAGPLTDGFKTNKCLGYIAPSVDGSCPSIPSPNPKKYDDRCLRFIDRNMGLCRAPTYTENDIGLSADCQEYVSRYFSYDACIRDHRDDRDFYGRAWHTYLNRPAGLWRSYRDVLSLYNAAGKIIDTYKY